MRNILPDNRGLQVASFLNHLVKKKNVSQPFGLRLVQGHLSSDTSPESYSSPFSPSPTTLSRGHVIHTVVLLQRTQTFHMNTKCYKNRVIVTVTFFTAAVHKSNINQRSIEEMYNTGKQIKKILYRQVRLCRQTEERF